MTVEAQTEGGRRRALLVVRNTFEHDARVLRAAGKLQELGFEVTVLAALGGEGAGRREERQGPVHVVRVGPPARVRRAYRAVRGMVGGHRGSSPPAAAYAADAAVLAAASPGTRAGKARAGRNPSVRAAPAVRSALRRVARWGATLDFYARGIAFARGQRPDLVHCNDHNTMWIGLAARLGRGAALVYDSHELWPDRNLRPEARWWLLLTEALFVRMAHAVVMTSPAHAEVLARRYRVAEPAVVRNIPARNGPRPAGEALTAEAGAGGAATGDGGAGEAGSGEDRERVAVYVGGLLRHRGLEESIRALAHLDGVRLQLLGPAADDYRAELEALARDGGVHHRVEFVPPVPPNRVVETLRHADVGLALFQPVCLSHRLVLPNKLFEYAHAGLPMVGSDLPMITRFVRQHGVGEVVDAADVEAIAAAIRNVLQPGRHEHLREASLRTGRELDWDRESELLAEVYRSALQRARS